LRKPDPRIFSEALRRANYLPPQNCAFIDDLRINCEAAHELGFKTHQFENVPKCREFLKKYELLAA